jgi:HAMP domain-containing protein
MALKWKVPLIVLIITILTQAVMVFVSYNAELELLKSSENQQLTTISNLVKAKFVQVATDAESRATLVASIPDVASIMREGNRDSMARLLLDSYKNLSNMYGVGNISFYTPPATVFLRLNDLQAFGDDGSAIRPMVVIAHNRKEAQKGLEIGRNGPFIYGVAPLSDAKGLVGSVSSNMSLPPVMEDLKRITGAEFAVFIDDAQMTSIATQVAKVDDERIMAGLRNFQATNWSVTRSLISPSLLKNPTEVRFASQTLNDTSYGIVLVPIQDFSGRNLGVVMASINLDKFQQLNNTSLLNLIVLAIFQLLIISGAVFLTYNGLLLRPIIALGEIFETITKGDYTQKLDDLTKRKDEVGKIAKKIEKYQKKLLEEQEEKEKEEEKEEKAEQEAKKETVRV